MAKTTPVTFQFTSPVVLAHPNLFTPRKFRDERGVESGEPKYDFRAVIRPDHPELQAFRAKLIEVAKATWPNAVFSDPLNPPAPGTQFPANYLPVEWCIRSGDKMADKAKMQNPPRDREAYRGYWVLTSRGQYTPGLSVVLNGRVKDIPMSGEERAAAEPYFYGGVEALIEVQLVGYQVGNNNPVITAYPNVILSLNRGEKIAAFSGGTARSGAATFSAHIGQFTQSDPTAGMAAASADGIAGLV